MFIFTKERMSFKNYGVLNRLCLEAVVWYSSSAATAGAHGRQAGRVVPEGWNGLDDAAPPCVTPFEAEVVAWRLVELAAPGGGL